MVVMMKRDSVAFVGFLCEFVLIAGKRGAVFIEGGFSDLGCTVGIRWKDRLWCEIRGFRPRMEWMTRCKNGIS